MAIRRVCDLKNDVVSHSIMKSVKARARSMVEGMEMLQNSRAGKRSMRWHTSAVVLWGLQSLLWLGLFHILEAAYKSLRQGGDNRVMLWRLNQQTSDQANHKCGIA
jgi:hypothetical protein